MEKAEPQKEHEWLHRLVGDWTYRAESDTGDGEPPQEAEGTESVRSLVLGDDGEWHELMEARYRRA